ncbi:recombinase family protein [Streptomyces diastaticus]|uniref:recombinase family protein n=1 Tax=Streptomyces diastaticus TaxID=1956 RepID=UPI003662A65B
MNRARHGRANGAPVGSGLHLRLPISPPYRRDPAPQEGQRGARGMTGRLHLRHSTDKQTNARRLHALDDLPKSGSLRYENPATSSRMHAVNRSGFRKLLDEAAVGDTIRNAGAARLFRSTKDVIQIREGLQWRGCTAHCDRRLVRLRSRGRRPANQALRHTARRGSGVPARHASGEHQGRRRRRGGGRDAGAPGRAR